MLKDRYPMLGCACRPQRHPAPRHARGKLSGSADRALVVVLGDRRAVEIALQEQVPGDDAFPGGRVHDGVGEGKALAGVAEQPGLAVARRPFGRVKLGVSIGVGFQHDPPLRDPLGENVRAGAHRVAGELGPVPRDRLARDRRREVHRHQEPELRVRLVEQDAERVIRVLRVEPQAGHGRVEVGGQLPLRALLVPGQVLGVAENAVLEEAADRAGNRGIAHPAEAVQEVGRADLAPLAAGEARVVLEAQTGLDPERPRLAPLADAPPVLVHGEGVRLAARLSAPSASSSTYGSRFR
jgi:hypothetical protein